MDSGAGGLVVPMPTLPPLEVFKEIIDASIPSGLNASAASFIDSSWIPEPMLNAVPVLTKKFWSVAVFT